MKISRDNVGGGRGGTKREKKGNKGRRQCPRSKKSRAQLTNSWDDIESFGKTDPRKKLKLKKEKKEHQGKNEVRNLGFFIII